MILKEFYIVSAEKFQFFTRCWEPDTPPKAMVFLFHGLADHSGRFEKVAEKFTAAGFLFFAADLRGNGKTEGPRGHFDSYDQIMRDTDGLLEAAHAKYPNIPVILYGQSMGGNLALNYSLRRKPEVAAVIASSPWLRLTKPPNAIVRTLGNALGKIAPAFIIPNGLNADDLSHSKVISKAYREDPLVHGKISLNTFKLITESGEWAIKNSSQHQKPLLLMHGTSDPITSIDASRQFAKGVKCEFTFRSWDGLKHELHNEPQSEEVINFMIEWLSQRLFNRSSSISPHET